MPAPPLTHHQIIELAEPFARQGLRLDLAASDRAQWQLVFQPTEHPPGADGQPALRETLVLKGSSGQGASGADWWTLTRTLAVAERQDAPGMPWARVEAQSTRPAELLAAVQTLAPAQVFSVGPGFVVARSYSVSPGGTSVMTGGTARLQGLRLEMTVPATRGVAASLVLTPTLTSTGPGHLTPTLPPDLLAVLGWNWAPIVRAPGGWHSRVRLRRRGPGRSADARARLDQAAAHLARTLAEAPGQFHDRHRRARWGVVLRRALPLLTAIALFTTILLLPRFGYDSIDGGPWLLLYHLPTLLLALSFTLQEMPRFEIPPLPRRSTDSCWLA